MLDETERQQIAETLRQYPEKRAAAIDALKIVQSRRGWISDESLADVAGVLDMTPAEVESVATFYNLIFRKPVGRHVAFVCDSISCWIMGYERVRDQLKDRYDVDMGQTTKDGRLTVLPIACLGHCEKAPAMMIDADVYGQVTPEKIESIVERYQ
ncbi:MAG TPA: NADH-quinone oxidoreductase subunit NuoE [Nitrospira sp.]|nr:NADH-quinone oxidoreductase subunit NuoE [Nitrospira sp.]